MNYTALRRSFLRIVMRLDRSFAKHLSSMGITWLINLMTHKISRLRRRLERRSLGKWRRKWIQARIRIRLHAIRWLKTNRRGPGEMAIRQLAKEAAQTPYPGTVERYKTWLAC